MKERLKIYLIIRHSSFVKGFLQNKLFIFPGSAFTPLTFKEDCIVYFTMYKELKMNIVVRSKIVEHQIIISFFSFSRADFSASLKGKRVEFGIHTGNNYFDLI